MTTEVKAYSYIRFSTPIQQRGDSLNRQLEKSRKYAKEHNLILDESMKDQGFSAFRGKHLKKGILGEFVRLINEGKIVKGSILLIENIDRLSREAPGDALNLFMTIINSGIEIVTLDGVKPVKYSIKSINEDPTQLPMLAGEIVRANKESTRKSELLKDTWEHKRQNLDVKKKLTGRVPQWIEVTNDAKEPFKIRQDVQSAILLIFQKKLLGKGEQKIVRELNLDPYVWKPEKSKTNKFGGWQSSTVTKILRNQQLLGEYQPCKMVDGSREISGNAIKKYFPPAIDSKLFYRVQSLIHTNSLLNGNAGGISGKAYNVFAHIVKCGLCGNSMHYVDKGKDQYLHCSSSRVKKIDQCTAKPIRYNEFFNLFFNNFDELNINQLIPEEQETKVEIREAYDQIQTNKGMINDINDKIENLNLQSEVALTHGRRIIIEQRIAAHEAEKRKCEDTIVKKQEKIDHSTNQRIRIEKDFEGVKEIHQLLNSAKDEEEKINIRLKLRSVLSNMIEWIKIYPLHDDPNRLENLKIKYAEAGDLLQSSIDKKSSFGKKIRLVALKERIRDIEEAAEIDSGIIQIFDSKSIEKVRVKYRGINKLSILYLRWYVEDVL